MPARTFFCWTRVLLVATCASSLVQAARATGPVDDTTPRAGVTRLDSDRYRALEPGAEGSAAIARVLADHHRRGDGEGGFAWWMKLPIAVRSRQANHTQARRWRNRIEFLRDAQRGDGASCAISARPVLDDVELVCGYAAELHRYLACTASLPVGRRDELLDGIRIGAQLRLDDASARCPADAEAIAAARMLLDRGKGETGSIVHPQRRATPASAWAGAGRSPATARGE